MHIKKTSSSSTKSVAISRRLVVKRANQSPRKTPSDNDKREDTLTKRERLEARISPKQKKLLIKAALLQGRSLSDFMITTLEKEARKIVHDYEALDFALAEKMAFISSLENPPEPSESLVEAFSRLQRVKKHE